LGPPRGKPAKAGQNTRAEGAGGCLSKCYERELAHGLGRTHLDASRDNPHLIFMEQIYLILSVGGFLALNGLAYTLRPTCPQERPDERPQRRR